MKPFTKFFSALLGILFVLGSISAWAGITGSISGVVSDPNGAVVAGVTVIATEVSTNIQHTTVTDAKGFYAFPALNVGNYNVSVSQAGFRDFLESGVVINANSAIRIDIKMEMGAVSNTVRVRSDVLQVETQSTQMGDVIEGEKITSVPLNGRSYIDLLALQPGVSPYSDVATSSGSGVTSISGDMGMGLQSVNGGQPEGNGFMVNGADAEEGVHNAAAMIPNLDSIAQFRIITNNFNAEYGNFSGGQINVVTKSGTNQYHGDAFDFLRNTDLDAKNYYSPDRGVYIQNQFGGTIGGPIKKDKLFFFGDFQGTKQIIGQATNFAVPSTEDRTGNLADQTASLELSDPNNPVNPGQGVQGAYFASVLSQELGYPVSSGEPYYTPGCTDTGTCVFPNAVIPATAISPVAQNMLKYIPTSNSVQNRQPFYQTSAFNQTLTDYKGGIRIDTNTRYGALFGYYFADNYTVVNPYAAVNIPGFNAGSNGMTQMANFGLTTTINNSTVNDLRLVYLRNVNFSGVPVGGLGVSLTSLGFNTPWGPTGGIDSTDPSLEGVPNVGFNNYSFGVPPDTLRQFNNTIQIIDNVTKIVGTHTIQFGGDYHYDQINERNTYGQNGQFGFGGQETGYDFADYLIGAPNYFIQASYQILDSRSKYYGLYAQDSWRVTPTVTLNYGLRWEVATPWYDTQNKLETLIQGEQSLSFPGAPTGLVVPLDPGVPRTLSPVKYTNFAPRIGIAFAPDVTDGWLGKLLGGPGKTSIRAGYGIFYTSIIDATGFVEVGDAPYGLFYASPGPPLFASPYVTRQTGQVQANAFPFVFPPTNVSPSNPDTTFPWSQVEPISGSDYFSPKNVLPYAQQFELSLERQLGTNTVASVSYVGAVGRHNLTFIEANPGDPALCLYLNNPANVAPNTGTCLPGGEQNQYIEADGTVVNSTRTRFGSNFGADSFMSSSASSSYNSLQISLQHTEKYANFLVGYTWSKSMDNGSGVFDPTNVFNPAASRALSTFDVPQNLVISYTVQLPFNNFIGKSGGAKRFTAGWAISGITSFVSGEPVQLGENDDYSLIGANTSFDAPNYANNGSPLYINRNPRKGLPYFNPNYFTRENIGQVGDVMRRSFVGPGINNWDMALLKDTEIAGDMKLQFRAEAFNVFNHAQFYNPDGTYNDIGSFGFVSGARDPRIMQVALKLLF
jgi:hypothetical protein